MARSTKPILALLAAIGAAAVAGAEDTSEALTVASPDGRIELRLLVAEAYTDAPDAGMHPTKTAMKKKQASASSALEPGLAEGGGAAVRLRPAG